MLCGVRECLSEVMFVVVSVGEMVSVADRLRPFGGPTSSVLIDPQDVLFIISSSGLKIW